MKITFSKKENSTKSLNPIIKNSSDRNSNYSFTSTPVKKQDLKKFSHTEIYSEGKNLLSPLKTSQQDNIHKNYKTNYSNYNSNIMGRINSLQPFQKVDHDFYVEKTECSLWGKESNIIKAEKKIFSEKKLSNQNVSNFGGVNVVKQIILLIRIFTSNSHVYFQTKKITQKRKKIFI